MEPIVSPWLIYFIDLADNLGFVCICGVITCAYFYVRLGCEIDELNEKGIYATETRKNLKRTKIFACIFMLLLALTPDKETSIKMLIAYHLTPDNIATVTKYAGETVNAAGNYTEHVTLKALDLITDSAIKIIKEIK